MSRDSLPRQRPGRPGRPKLGHVLLVARIRPDQRDALERLAEKDREARGMKRLDVAKVVRWALDKALRLRPKT